MRPCCSRSQAPSSCCQTPTPAMGVSMVQSRSRSRSIYCVRSPSRSRSFTPARPQHPVMPAPTSLAPGILRPSSHSAFTPVGRRSPSPSPFYSFKGFWIEEQAFLHDICDEIGTMGDLYSVAVTVDSPILGLINS